MVELKALKNCTISFIIDGNTSRFVLKENEIIEENNDLIIEKLLNTKLLKQIN